MDMSNFAIVTCISNPMEYKSRYAIYKQWAAEIEKSGVKLITVELAFGDRPFMITERDNQNHVQLRTDEVLWHKENMLNIGMQYCMQVYPGTEKIAWIDADTFPVVPVREWLEKTSAALEHYYVVQMFENALWLDPKENPVGGPGRGIIANYYQAGLIPPRRGGNFGHYAQHSRTGLAWAARTEAISWLGGLIDYAVLGSADWYMAFALLGGAEESIPPGMHEDYVGEILQWARRAEKFIKKDVGYVPGLVVHRWHGKIVDRQYYNRNTILIENEFQPNVDLKKDVYGLISLEVNNERQRRLRDLIRLYMAQRNEDSIDV